MCGYYDNAVARPVSVARIRIATVIAVLILWEGVARSGLLYAGVMPPLTAVGAAFARLLIAPVTYRHLAVTGWEIIAGFALGLTAGVTLGIVMGARRFFARAIAPYLDGLATTPKIVFLPIAMLMFGVGMESKIALGALSAFFPVVLNTAAGMREINPVWVRVGRGFNLTPWQMTRKIYLPALARSLAVSMRLGLGVAIIGVLLAEIKLSDSGLGFLAIEHYNHFRIADMYALLIFIFILAIGANLLITRLDKVRNGN